MKKITTILMSVLFFAAYGQSPVRDLSQLSGMHVLPNHVPVVKADASRAAGDTVFYFDGNVFRGNGLDTSTFAFQNEDIDNKTVAAQLTGSGYDPTSAFVFFFEVNSVTGDTNVYISATSWFNPTGQADNWFEMGPITIPAAGATMSWGHNMNDGSFRDGYKVKVSTTGLNNYTDFTNAPIFTVADNAPSTIADTVNTPDNIFATRSVDLTAYAGQAIFIAFHHDANDMFILNLDNVLITENPVSVNDISLNAVSSLQNQPNPVMNHTNISYMLSKPAVVSLDVTDITGRVVMSTNEGSKTAGHHNISLDVKSLNAGVYFYTLHADGARMSNRMVVTK